MKTLIAMMMLMGSTAFADGFVCYTQDESLKIKMLNHVQPGDGTRTGSVMIVSDQTMKTVNKTTVAFSQAEESLVTQSTKWIGIVTDAALEEVGGRNLAGTKLDRIKYFTVEVGHNYGAPVASGEHLFGELNVTKINGDVLTHELNCYRYLKN